MGNRIRPKRSYTAGAVPTASELDTNEVALNFADGKLFVKNTSGQILTFSMGGSGGTEDTLVRSLLVPPAPTGVTASAGTAQATVSWTAPTSAVAVTDYVVQYSSNSGSTWTTFSDGTSTSASATVTGLTNGTAYTFRVAASNALGTGAYSAASSAVTPGGDSLWSSVSLLLPFDGSGSTITDASNSAHSLTAYGNATQSSTQSKWGGKSLYLDGSGDYLTAPISSAFEFGTGDFSMEAWVRLDSTDGWQRIAAIGDGASGAGIYTGWSWAISGTYLRFYRYDGSEYLYDATISISTGTWYYVAVARSGTTLRMYLDGSLVGTFTGVSAAFDRVNTNNFYIGFVTGGMGDKYYAGYIDDLRITKGQSRGFTGSTITVPTAPFQTF